MMFFLFNVLIRRERNILWSEFYEGESAEMNQRPVDWGHSSAQWTSPSHEKPCKQRVIDFNCDGKEVTQRQSYSLNRVSEHEMIRNCLSLSLLEIQRFSSARNDESARERPKKGAETELRKS